MKNLFNINKWFVIATLILYLTFYLGALFQIVLGAVQVLMSLYIITRFKSLTPLLKQLFSIYVVLTTVVLALIFTESANNNLWIAVHLVVPMLIAIFHLYITYRIKNEL